MALARFQVDTGSISGLARKLFQDYQVPGKCDFCIEKTIFRFSGSLKPNLTQSKPYQLSLSVKGVKNRILTEKCDSCFEKAIHVGLYVFCLAEADSVLSNALPVFLISEKIKK